MAKTKIRMSAITMMKYIKSRLGYSGESKVSNYTLACKALEMDGRPLPSVTTWKKWTELNYVYIQEEACKLNGVSLRGYDKRKPPQTPAVRSPHLHRKTIKAAKAKTFTRLFDDPFLQSYAWRKLRMDVLVKYGARCQCCGATAKDGVRICVDHIKPRKLYPELALDITNLGVLCAPCNHGKGNTDQTDWR